MPEYRKKPVVIDAVKWEGGDSLTLADEPLIELLGRNDWRVTDDGIVIGTLEGEMLASPGDWIIRGVKGELYPCKPDIFAATYEPADGWSPAICGHCGDPIDRADDGTWFHEEPRATPADQSGAGTGDVCPQGRTDYAACYAPFRYCPVKGCGRAEGGVRLPTDAVSSFEHGVHTGRLLHAAETQGSVLTEDTIGMLLDNAPGGNYAHGWLCEWLASDPEQRTAMTAALADTDEARRG